MLSTATPFPQVGSFALFADDHLPPAERRAELARLLERGHSTALIALPLRSGAAGNRRVPLADLIDATPLDSGEQRELADLQRHLRGRARLTPKMQVQQARAEDLRRRALFALVMESELAKLKAREAAAQPPLARASRAA